VHQKDLAEGEGKTSLPSGLARKYSYAMIDFKWQYAFPSTVRYLPQLTATIVAITFTGQLF
jgi:hypothetical protein